MIPKRVKLALRLATDIVGKLPSKGDSIIQVIVKLLSIADSAESIFSPGKANALSDLITKYNLTEVKNASFVGMFFETKLHESFETHYYSLTDYMDIVEASHSAYGRLFFTKYSSYGDYEDTFYHSKGFDFQQVLQGMWDLYEGRLHISLRSDNRVPQFTTFKPIPNPLYGRMKVQMEEMVARHRRWQTSKIPRTYMLFGEPGTGKSSFAHDFAERLGERTLKVDAPGLTTATVQDISFLLANLQPSFFFVDDVDKINSTESVATLLAILERFKTEHPEISVLMTSNKTDSFDSGFLRPNRIDTWVPFGPPDAQERRDVLGRYFSELNVQVPDALLDQVVEMTAKLTHDYLREIALLLKHDEVKDVLETIAMQVKLLESNTKAKEKSAEAPKPNGTPEETKPIS